LNYDPKHVSSLPVVKNQPAYVGDAILYIQVIVTIAALEGVATAPPGTRAHLRMRPVGEKAWCYYGPVADLTYNGVKEALQTCIDDDEGRVEVDITWMTEAEANALPEFDGW
jgi:hypothetical protein